MSPVRSYMRGDSIYHLMSSLQISLINIKRRVSYIMKTLCNEPQKRVNDLYPLLQIIMRPKREVIPQ